MAPTFLLVTAGPCTTGKLKALKMLLSFKANNPWAQGAQSAGPWRQLHKWNLGYEVPCHPVGQDCVEQRPGNATQITAAAGPYAAAHPLGTFIGHDSFPTT